VRIVRRRVLLAALAALVVLAAAGLWRARLRLAEALVTRAVAAAGMAGARVTVAEIGPRRARLVELRAGESAELEIAELTLRYSLLGLLRGRVGELTLDGLRLRGRVGADGLSLGPADGAGRGGGGVPGLPPIDQIRLRDARLELETPAGPLALAADAELARAGAGLEAALALRARHAAGAGELAIDLHGTESDLVLTLRSGAFHFEVPELGRVEAADVRGEFAVADGRLGPGELAIGSLRAPRLAPLALRLRTSADRTDGDGPAPPIAVELGLAAGRAVLAGEGRLQADPPAANLTLGGSLGFTPDGLQPRDLAPELSSWLASAAGSVGVRATARLSEGGVDLALHVETEGLDLETPGGVSLEGLAGKADFLGPAPFRTREPESWRFRRADLIGPFEEGELRWQLRGSELEVLDATWRYAGGRLGTAGRFDLGAEQQPFTVEVSGVSLGLLLEQLELADLSGSGLLSGALPLVFDGESFRVEGGALAADEPGVVRYAPAGAAAAGLGVGGDLEVLVGALEELHYDKLRLELDGVLSGDVRLRAEIRGRNPHYEGGRPVELNLSLEANLPALLRGGRSVTRVPEVIERRLQGRVPAE
jgi:hypothetical protein